jgi:hypothetical protein
LAHIVALLMIVVLLASGCATREVSHAGPSSVGTGADVLAGAEPVQTQTSGLSREGKIALGIGAGGAAALLLYAILPTLAAIAVLGAGG